MLRGFRRGIQIDYKFVGLIIRHKFSIVYTWHGFYFDLNP